MTGIRQAVALAAGGEYACAVLASGSTECWGEGGFGDLGDGKTKSSDIPVKVTGLTDATSVAADINHGESQVCAERVSGSIDCWGGGFQGQLGNDASEEAPATTPVLVQGISNARNVAAGNSGTCAALSGGEVDCWGSNYLGQLGDGTTSGPETCGLAESPFSCSRVPVSVSDIAQATAVSAGEYNACALLTSGGVDCWGSNEEGQLGDGTTTSSATPVAVDGLG